MRKALLVCVAIIAATAMGRAQQVVCHRGMWDESGSAQNSIRSLVKADSIGAWGTEFDVWLSDDGTLFVNHDPTIDGVEIQHSKTADIQWKRLPNGERIPTLSQVLSKATGLKINLVIELKRHTKLNGDQNKGRERKAVKAITEMVREFGLESRVTYISFSAFAVEEFLAVAPAGTPVYYLDGRRGQDAPGGKPVYLLDSNLNLNKLKSIKAAGIDYRYEVLFTQPELINQCHSLGMKVNVWTVDDPQELRWCVEHGVDFITTNDPVTAKFYIDAK